MQDDVIIRVRDLKTQFGDQVIHEHLDLDIHSGEVLGIVGGSGTGKSVLLRTILGLNRPVAGSIEIFGKLRSEMTPADAHAAERRWGVLFQDGALFSSLTVTQNIQVPLKEHLKLPVKLMDEIAALKIALVGLPAEAGPKYPSELSGGMRKRAGLARALSLDPEIVFLDEPTAGLDPTERNRFLNLQAGISEEVTVILSTHIVADVRELCRQMAIIAQGQVIVEGEPETVISQVADRVWQKAVEKQELSEIESRYRVISRRLVGGRPVVTIYSETDPGDGFRSIDADLEDAYFFHTGAAGKVG